MTVAEHRVLIRGAGELASATAHHLFVQGFRRILLLDRKYPKAVRRRVCFSEAILDGRQEIQGVVARFQEGAASGILNAPMPTADPRVDPLIRRKIEEAFGCQVRESMGIGDISLSAWAEDDDGKGMHFMPRGFVHVELIDPASRRVVRTLAAPPHRQLVTSLATSGDGRWLGVGSGWGRYADELSSRLTGVEIIAHDAAVYPHAGSVARLGAYAYQNGRVLRPEQAQPSYLRDRVAEKPGS